MPTDRAGAPPEGPELVFGLVGAVGVDLRAVTDALQRALNGVHYETTRLHLTDHLEALEGWDFTLPETERFADRVGAYMTAGNELRRSWTLPDAFALLAVHAIRIAREGLTRDPDQPAPRHAYVLHSLKRLEEAQLLRRVYGDHFILISAYSPRTARHARIVEEIERTHSPIPDDATDQADGLIARDEKERDDFGQNLRAIFPKADLFVDVTGDLSEQVTRAIELIFGHPSRTPTRHELGMFHAHAAALRSGDLGRQVGAAICTPRGSLVATGSNEVPVPGGGLYWADDDRKSPRDWDKGYDANDQRKHELAKRIADELTKARVTTDADRAAAIIATSRLDDLIEFVRAVHAEMAAITDAALRGVALQDSTLYATTFPCHHCARHIVAAGIVGVQYVEPYPKSRAVDLHDDAITVDGEGPHDGVPFRAFVGVGPRRFLEWFAAGERKDHATGKALTFDCSNAIPPFAKRDAELTPPQPEYVFLEGAVALLRLFRGLKAGPTLVGVSLEDPSAEPPPRT